MLTLLGSIIGFVGSLIPNFFKLYQDKADRLHELELFDRQLKLLKHNHAQKLDELYEERLTRELTMLYQNAAPTGVKWVDALSGTVRPVITYCFFLLFCTVKLCQVFTIMEVTEALSLARAILRIWHEEDQALFAAVMSFWFGQRALHKFTRK